MCRRREMDRARRGASGSQPPASGRLPVIVATARALIDERGRRDAAVDEIGSMHLARGGVGMRESPPGVAETFDVDPGRVREARVQDALAQALITDGPSA